MRTFLSLLLLAGCHQDGLSVNSKGRDLGVLADFAFNGLPCSTNCMSGCCDSAGICHTGVDSANCGSWAGACADCIDSQCIAIGSGHGGSCVTPDGGTCNVYNCSTGCCQGSTCITAINEQTCGTFGESCYACAPGDSCKGACFHPQPNCGPSNCAGCCEGDSCASGINNNACGQSGQACSDCRQQRTICLASGKGGICGGAPCGSCPTGCCMNGQCYPGNSVDFCGGSGRFCQDCTVFGDQCIAAAPSDHRCGFETGCLAQSCAGCCYGDVCAVGTQDLACGATGGVCVNCTVKQQTCVNGICG